MRSSSCFSFGGGGVRHEQVPHEQEDDALLARELNALSMEERNRVYDEIHGVNKIQQETGEFVSERIEAMKQELSKLPPTRRRSFDRACFLKPTLENDHGFYLMFLRADRFDAESAARKLCLHFDHKLELFGEAKLPKKITLEDLNEDDLEVFQSCAYIVLKKDRSGRQPQLLNMPRMKFKSWKNQVRYTWYTVFNILLADEDTQKNGIVDVMYFVDMQGVPDYMLHYVRDAHHILSAMPVRSCGFHICYNSKLIRSFLSFLHVVTPNERKIRERTHYGSHLEVEYKLCTFGIDMRDLDSKKSATAFGDEYIQAFMRNRRQIESEEKREQLEKEKQSGVILHPGPYDVLCGRGRPYQDFCGNVRVGQLVDDQVQAYLTTKERHTKTKIAYSIVKRVHAHGGRFLTKGKDGWEIAQEKVARGKISQALRVRTLKKIRSEGMEPVPLPSKSNFDLPDGFGPINVDMSERDSKRARMSDDSELGGDEDEKDDLLDFDLLPFDDNFEISMISG